MKLIQRVEPRLFILSFNTIHQTSRASEKDVDLFKLMKNLSRLNREVHEWCNERQDIVEYRHENDSNNNSCAVMQFKTEQDALMFILTFSYYIEQDFDGIR